MCYSVVRECQLSLKNFMDFQLSVRDLRRPYNWELKTMVSSGLCHESSKYPGLRSHVREIFKKSTYLALWLLILMEIENVV